MNKGAYVNRLDYVVLGALEIDLDFNVNVVTGSDGVVRGAPGGHPDTSAGSNCSIIVAPLLRSRIPTVCDRVVTVTTPGSAWMSCYRLWHSGQSFETGSAWGLPGQDFP